MIPTEAPFEYWNPEAVTLPEAVRVFATIDHLARVLPSSVPTVFEVGYTPVALAVTPDVVCEAAFTTPV